MDIAFHGLAGLVISKATAGEYLTSAAVFSVIPDLLGTTAFQYFKFKNSSKNSIKAFTNDWMKFAKQNKFFTKWDRFAYRVTHSLLSLPFVALFTFVFFENIWWILTICYLFHLLIDIPAHEGEFAFRPFWPFSDWNLQGKSWINPGVFLTFWVILIVVFLFQLLI